MMLRIVVALLALVPLVARADEAATAPDLTAGRTSGASRDTGLARGPRLDPIGAEAGKLKARVCAACHGVDGNSTNPLYPILAGQTARYIYLQLNDFKAGRRKDPTMSPFAANLTSQDMLDLAEYFSTQKFQPTGFVADPAKVAKGRAKAQQVLCTMCHLGEFSGQNEIPREAGQHPQYIVKQLKAFRDRTRTNDAGTMTSYTSNLTDEDIEDLAQYIANIY